MIDPLDTGHNGRCAGFLLRSTLLGGFRTGVVEESRRVAVVDYVCIGFAYHLDRKRRRSVLLGIHQNHPVTKLLWYNTSSLARFIVLMYWDTVFCVYR